MTVRIAVLRFHDTPCIISFRPRDSLRVSRAKSVCNLAFARAHTNVTNRFHFHCCAKIGRLRFGFGPKTDGPLLSRGLVRSSAKGAGLRDDELCPGVSEISPPDLSRGRRTHRLHLSDSLFLSVSSVVRAILRQPFALKRQRRPIRDIPRILGASAFI